MIKEQDVYDIAGKIAEGLKAYDVPQEKEKDIVGYSMNLLVKNPHMKVKRIVRKTAEYFKLSFKSNQEL